MGDRQNRNPIAVVVTGEDGAAAGDPIAHTVPARVTTTAATATDILAAGLALNGLIIINTHASEPVNIRTDGSDATSATGIPLIAGAGIVFGPGEIPTGKISGYSTNAGTVQAVYW